MFRQDPLGTGNCLLHRRWSARQRPHQARCCDLGLRAQSRHGGVAERSFGALLQELEGGVRVSDPLHDDPGAGERLGVAEALELPDRRPRFCEHQHGVLLRVGVEQSEEFDHACAQLDAALSRGFGFRLCLAQHLERLRQIGEPEVRPAQHYQQRRSLGLVFGKESQRALEQRARRAHVGARPCSKPSRSEQAAGTVGQRRVRGAQLDAVAMGLLEVVTEYLVHLDEFRPVPFEPVCKARVKIRPRRLRERLVGGVPDQDMPEAEAVLARDLRPVWANEFAAYEAGQPCRHLRLFGCKRLHGAPVEDLALDRTPLEHAPLGCVDLVEAGGEQRAQVRRHADLAVCGFRHRHHLGDEERVAARRPRYLLAKRRRQCGGHEFVDVPRFERSEP